MHSNKRREKNSRARQLMKNENEYYKDLIKFGRSFLFMTQGHSVFRDKQSFNSFLIFIIQLNDSSVYSLIAEKNNKTARISGRSPECSDCLLRFMEQQ